MERSTKQRCFLKSWLVTVLMAATGFAFAESPDKPEGPLPANPETLVQETLGQKTLGHETLGQKTMEQLEASPATSVKQDQAAIQVPRTSTKDDLLMATLQKQFPQLERALIIVTAVNIVIVIFAALLYSVKRRMKQFSPVPLASMRQNRG